jgi:hypothetical protein
MLLYLMYRNLNKQTVHRAPRISDISKFSAKNFEETYDWKCVGAVGRILSQIVIHKQSIWNWAVMNWIYMRLKDELS